jgi:hypothetical protein
MAFGAAEDNRLCVNPAHLFLGTAQDNSADMVAKGRSERGERHWQRRRPELRHAGDDHWSHLMPDRVLRGEANGRAIMTAARVQEARALWQRGGMTMRELAAAFGMSEGAMAKVVHRVSWRHVP